MATFKGVDPKGNDLAKRVSSAERACKERATYHVYYRRNGKTYFDPAWEATAEKSEAFIMKSCKEVFRRSNVELVGSVLLDPTTPVG